MMERFDFWRGCGSEDRAAGDIEIIIVGPKAGKEKDLFAWEMDVVWVFAAIVPLVHS